MKKIESLLKIAGIEFDLKTWKSVFTNIRCVIAVLIFTLNEHFYFYVKNIYRYCN